MWTPDEIAEKLGLNLEDKKTAAAVKELVDERNDSEDHVERLKTLTKRIKAEKEGRVSPDRVKKALGGDDDALESLGDAAQAVREQRKAAAEAAKLKKAFGAMEAKLQGMEQAQERSALTAALAPHVAKNIRPTLRGLVTDYLVGQLGRDPSTNAIVAVDADGEPVKVRGKTLDASGLVGDLRTGRLTGIDAMPDAFIQDDGQETPRNNGGGELPGESTADEMSEKEKMELYESVMR